MNFDDNNTHEQASFADLISSVSESMNAGASAASEAVTPEPAMVEELPAPVAEPVAEPTESATEDDVLTATLAHLGTMTTTESLGVAEVLAGLQSARERRERFVKQAESAVEPDAAPEIVPENAPEGEPEIFIPQVAHIEPSDIELAALYENEPEPDDFEEEFDADNVTATSITDEIINAAEVLTASAERAAEFAAELADLVSSGGDDELEPEENDAEPDEQSGTQEEEPTQSIAAPKENEEIVRERVMSLRETNLRIITLASGKGGAGKSAIAVNLAVALAQLGLRALIFDADFGMANIDVMLGVQTKFNLRHFLRGEKTLDEIVNIGYDGVRFISGGSGLSELLQITSDDIRRIVDGLRELEMPIDVIICDGSAGVGDSMLQMLLESDEAIVVTTPEPTAVLDAYALVRAIVARRPEFPISVIMNKAETRKEADHVLSGFSVTLSQHLKKEVRELGHVMFDPELPRSIKKQTPIIVSTPDSRFSRDVRNIARALLELEPEQAPTSVFSRFIEKLTAPLTLGDEE